MKIAILFETPYSGGGSFTHSINVCLDLKRFINKNKKIIIYTNFEKNYEIIKKLGLPVILFNNSFIDKIILKLSFYKFFRILFNLFDLNISLEKKLISNNIDFIYFPVISNTTFAIKKIKYVTTLLDLEHFKHSIYPEITKQEFLYREKLYFHCLPKSKLIISSYESIKKEISKKYSISLKKIFVIPYTPSRLFNSRKDDYSKVKKQLKHLNKYYFYPAQIWGHKNHISIIKAAKILEKKGYNINFVFSGRDRGYKKYLDSYIAKHKVKNIFFTGYLKSNEMNYAYKNCSGVIFTTVFGPNAIPPLEAWFYKKPLIYNDKLIDDVNKSVAKCINVKDPKEIYKTIIYIEKNKYSKKLINNGSKKLRSIELKSQNGYKMLNKILDKLFL